jgi:protein TonB
MSSLRLKNFCWISCICHFIAAMGLIAFVNDASPLKTKIEPLCFVNLDDSMLPSPAAQSLPPLQEKNTPAHVNRKPSVTNEVTAPSPVAAQDTAPQVHLEKIIAPPQIQTTVPPLPAVSQQSSQNPSRAPDVATKVQAPGSYAQTPVKNSTNPLPAGRGRMLTNVSFGSSSGPSFLHRELPVYPHIAKRFNKEGKVVLQLTIDEHGVLQGVEVLENPGFGFAAAAVEAIKRSRFNPARHEGRPTTSQASLPIRFTLSDAR